MVATFFIHIIHLSLSSNHAHIDCTTSQATAMFCSILLKMNHTLQV